jgi:hypothetical protein
MCKAKTPRPAVETAGKRTKYVMNYWVQQYKKPSAASKY